MIEERDVIIVGAGFAGMYMLHRLRRLGQAATIIEAGGGLACISELRRPPPKDRVDEHDSYRLSRTTHWIRSVSTIGEVHSGCWEICAPAFSR